MSDDVINANPTVIDVADLPTRLNEAHFKQETRKHELLEDIGSLSLFSPTAGGLNGPQEVENVAMPDLMSDVSDAESSEDEKFDEETQEIDAQEIFDLISTMSDPEHPLTLAQLAVVNLPDIHVKNGPNKEKDLSEVLIKITPTITHCSLATLIGLGIRVRLERCLPPRFRIRILIKEGTHQSENQVNKQLNDKERVAAACENEQLLSVILQMLSSCK